MLNTSHLPARRLAVALVVFGLALALALPTSARAQPVAPASATQTGVMPGAVTAKSKAGYKRNGSFRITPEAFGIHSFVSDLGVPAGAVRLNGAPLWREIQPKRNTWRWKRMDLLVERAERWGVKNIMFVVFGTPYWAASKVPFPSSEVAGKRSTSPPKKSAYWKKFVTKVVKRYKGRITTYQAWNEITSTQFYQGSAKRMAKMTRTMSRIVAKHDPKARVVAASVQTHRKDRFDAVVPEYFRQLGKLGWPVDAIAGHFYPSGRLGPKGRVKQIEMFARAAERARVPSRVERWDTETNYRVGADSGGLVNPKGRVRGKKAARWVARTYLDSWRMGLRRTYWYLWTDGYYAFPGIQMYSAKQPGVKAYKKLAGWTIGSRFKGCSDSRGVTTCRFEKSGSKFRIVYSKKGKKSFRIGSSTKVCQVYGSKCRTRSGKITLTTMPTRLT